MFNFNIKKHVARLTPPFWRTAFQLGWLESLLSPLKTVNESFVSWVTSKRVELTYNGQTIHLERMLNDIFDSSLRRIKIIHSTDLRDYDYFFSEEQPGDYDYFFSELQPARYSWFTFEFALTETQGFRVTVPAELASLEDQIKGQILIYKIATIQYELNYI